MKLSFRQKHVPGDRIAFFKKNVFEDVGIHRYLEAEERLLNVYLSFKAVLLLEPLAGLHFLVSL